MLCTGELTQQISNSRVTRYVAVLLCRHYIVICAIAENSEQLIKWSGLVESKIRILIGQLENNEAFQAVHIYPRSYDAPSTIEEPEAEGGGGATEKVGNIWFIGLKLKSSGEISITAEAQMFINAGMWVWLHWCCVV